MFTNQSSCSDTLGANLEVLSQVTDWNENAVKVVQDAYETFDQESLCYGIGEEESKVIGLTCLQFLHSHSR